MFEKVNPSHPDKIADRIAGAIVDYAYRVEENPKIAVEVLIGHGKCNIIAESSVTIPFAVVESIVSRINKETPLIELKCIPQDKHLAGNQSGKIRCGDNGIFKGMPVTDEQKELSKIAREIYKRFPYDGKYIIHDEGLVVCQSNANKEDIESYVKGYNAIINPLGYWTGGTEVDTGATNRKLGSDMGDAVTGGGLHGKDLSKADVSINIYAHLLARIEGVTEICCAIGDETVNGVPYSEIVEIARDYIRQVGGFEKFAEWGLI